ncbi:MAG: hypothetical protein OCU22_03900 [Canidatus Methanoxibalbensis ujae]|nr:hypothetical protein [Candidatus Methanoxibalbensis ujae]
MPLETRVEGTYAVVDVSGIWTAVKAANDYVLVPNVSALQKSDESVIDTEMQTEPGVHARRDYKLSIPGYMEGGGMIVLFGSSGALNSVASDSNAARVNLKVYHGSPTGGDLLGSANGTERTPNNTSEQSYTEIIACTLSKYRLSGASYLTIRVELEVTEADANGIQMKLYADPETKPLLFYVNMP